MTGCWPPAAARKTGPKRWSGTRAWCGRSPAAAWPTSSHTRQPIRRGCGPPPPDLALLGVLAGHQHRLARDQQLLLDGHHRLAGAQARFGPGMTGRFPAHLVSVLSDRAEISQVSAALMNTARKDWMTLENLHTEMPLTGDFAQPPLPAFGGRIRCRSIYAAAAMD